MSEHREGAEAEGALLEAMRRVLAEAHIGEGSARVSALVPEAHPLRPLAAAIDDVIVALEDERARRLRLRDDLEEALATVELQQAALRELSTPILEVWQGVVCLPIIGVVEGDRAALMMNELLAAVAARRATHVILDLTGSTVMASQTLDQLVAMAKAVRLLGAECIFTGVQPSIAQALVTMAFDASAVTTQRSLREALTRLLDRR